LTPAPPSNGRHALRRGAAAPSSRNDPPRLRQPDGRAGGDDYAAPLREIGLLVQG
jgi:hypothetical protein